MPKTLQLFLKKETFLDQNKSIFMGFLALDWADWRPADYPLVTRVMAVSQENQSANSKDIFYDVEERIVKTHLVSESFEQSFSF